MYRVMYWALVSLSVLAVSVRASPGGSARVGHCSSGNLSRGFNSEQAAVQRCPAGAVVRPGDDEPQPGTIKVLSSEIGGSSRAISRNARALRRRRWACCVPAFSAGRQGA
jgi:hypothetical protein